MNKPSENRSRTVSDEKRKEIKSVKAKEKKLVKRLILIIFAVFILVSVLLLVLDRCEKKAQEADEHVSVEQIQEVYPSINPYPADFNKDLSDYNPDIMYEFADGSSFSIKDIPEDNQNEAHRFFLKYFDALKKGDTKAYASLFTKSYKKNPKGFEKDFTRKFPPQELFDIEVRELMRTTDTREEYTYEGKKCFFGYYIVSYKINENDGMFRRDLYDREIVRPLIFELVTFNKDTAKEETYIKNMYTESSIPKE